MLYLDYHWDLSENGILMDPEINVSRLHWQDGDTFQLQIEGGRARLVRVDKLEKFLEGQKVNV